MVASDVLRWLSGRLDDWVFDMAMNQLEDILPSWRKLSLTKIGYITQRIETIIALEELLKQEYDKGWSKAEAQFFDEAEKAAKQEYQRGQREARIGLLEELKREWHRTNQDKLKVGTLLRTRLAELSKQGHEDGH